MVSKVPSVTLNNGREIPQIGLGTWKSKPGEVSQAVKDAIDAGYRHIDCAPTYKNEVEVGAGIKAKIDQGVVIRSDLFIVSKLWNTFHSEPKVLPALQESLKSLGLDYLDLYLIHFPTGYKEDTGHFPKDENGKILYSDVDYLESWRGMEAAAERGLVRSIGLSNFNSEQIGRVLSVAKIKPTVLQVECHPFLNQRKLINFCNSKDITTVAYSPLGSPDHPIAKPIHLMDDPKLVKVAKKSNKTTVQVLLRYQIQRGVVVIPKSVTKSRIEANIDLFDFNLSQEDMAEIDALDRNGRVCRLYGIEDHKYYPFHAEF